MKLVHWPLMDGLLRLVHRGGGDWAGPQPIQDPPRCTKCNSHATHQTGVPITVLLYNSPSLCGFNVAVKGLKYINRDGFKLFFLFF